MGELFDLAKIKQMQVSENQYVYIKANNNLKTLLTYLITNENVIACLLTFVSSAGSASVLFFSPLCTKQSAEKAAGSWFDEAEYTI